MFFRRKKKEISLDKSKTLKIPNKAMKQLNIGWHSQTFLRVS
jgi:hypothetical protein